jgi:hypothetical protein
MLAGHAGAAGYWFWDRVVKLDLYSEFTHAARALQISGLPARTEARPAAVEIIGARPAPLVVAPARGWGPSTRFRYELPADATPERLEELSSILAAGPGSGPTPTVRPIEFAFTAPNSGRASVVLAGLPAAGGGIRVSLDGQEVFRHLWTALPDFKGPEDRRRQPAPSPIPIPYPAGAHTVALEGFGPSWVQVDRLIVPGLGRDLRAFAIADRDFALVRVQADDGAVPATIGLRIAGLADGPCRLTLIDLATGAERTQPAAIAGGELRAVDFASGDTALIVTR